MFIIEAGRQREAQYGRSDTQMGTEINLDSIIAAHDHCQAHSH